MLLENPQTQSIQNAERVRQLRTIVTKAREEFIVFLLNEQKKYKGWIEFSSEFEKANQKDYRTRMLEIIKMVVEALEIDQLTLEEVEFVCTKIGVQAQEIAEETQRARPPALRRWGETQYPRFKN